jgi:CHAT domain-containing protein
MKNKFFKLFLLFLCLNTWLSGCSASKSSSPTPNTNSSPVADNAKTSSEDFTEQNKKYRENGKYDEAIETLKNNLMAIKFNESPIERERKKDTFDSEYHDRLSKRLAVLELLGDTYSEMGMFDKAVESYQQYKEEGFKKEDFNFGGGADITIVTIQTKLGDALFRAGQQSRAEQELLNALKLIDGGAGMGIAGNYSEALEARSSSAALYAALQKLRIAQGKHQEALELAERLRSSVLRTELPKFSFALRDKIKSKTFNFSQIQAEAKVRNSTFVIYSILERPFKIYNLSKNPGDELIIWVVKPDGQLHFQDVKTTSIINTGIAVDPSKCISQQQCLEELYQVLIQPIEQLLPENPESEVVFFPYKELYSVPFAALRDKQGKYLIEKNIIYFAPGIEVINLLRERGKQNSFVASNNLVVGNPIMPKVATPLAQLPAAEAEAKEVARILSTQPLIGNQATEPAVTKQFLTAKIIHLATHAVNSKEQTFFALTPSGNDSLGKDNGLLTVDELYQFPLTGELAVLSACNTGSGEKTVEGVLGLARPFLVGGIPSVVASLWSIPDAPTKELMVNFYQNYQRNQDKAKSLRQAMLTTMKKHPDPKNWAAFVLIGLTEVPKSSVSRSQKNQAVGQMDCSNVYNSDPLNSSVFPIKRAMLESTSQGFNLRIYRSDDELSLEINNELGVKSHYKDEDGYFTVDENGYFEASRRSSSRTACSYSGRLEFLGDAKQKVLSLTKNRKKL